MVTGKRAIAIDGNGSVKTLPLRLHGRTEVGRDTNGDGGEVAARATGVWTAAAVGDGGVGGGGGGKPHLRGAEFVGEWRVFATLGWSAHACRCGRC